MAKSRSLMLASFLLVVTAASRADEPVTLKNLVSPKINNPDEPVAKSFSLKNALHFLDSAALAWQVNQGCFTCHTNYAYLYARPMVDAKVEAHREVRGFAERMIAETWAKKGPRWDAEVVCAAAALAFNDAHTTGKLHPLTKSALDRMRTIQRKDGGWEWLKCNWPPMESDDHYGVTLAAIAIGVAPEEYAKTETARAILTGIRVYLKENPPPTLHHRAMTLWAASYLPDLQSDVEKKQTIKALLDLQRPDGGWAVASLGDWKRGDAKMQDTETSDGYGTGFVLYVLHRAGLNRDKAPVKNGLAWLRANQRESGRWFARSLFRDNKHYLSHAGTAFAVMALRAWDGMRDR